MPLSSRGGDVHVRGHGDRDRGHDDDHACDDRAQHVHGGHGHEHHDRAHAHDDHHGVHACDDRAQHVHGHDHGSSSSRDYSVKALLMIDIAPNAFTRKQCSTLQYGYAPECRNGLHDQHAYALRCRNGLHDQHAYALHGRNMYQYEYEP